MLMPAMESQRKAWKDLVCETGIIINEINCIKKDQSLQLKIFFDVGITGEDREKRHSHFDCSLFWLNHSFQKTRVFLSSFVLSIIITLK